MRDATSNRLASSRPVEGPNRGGRGRFRAAAHTAAALILYCCCSVESAVAQPTAIADSGHLVIPFENVGRDPRVGWLAEACAVALTDGLAAMGIPVFSREERLRAFDELRVPPVATLSDATIIRVGELIRASDVVIGTFQVAGDRLTVRARAIRLDSGHMSPQIEEDGSLTDFFTVLARVALRLVPDSSASIDPLLRDRPSVAAFEQYVKGTLAENPAVQATFFKEALRLSPEYHPPRLALWTIYADQGEHQQALDILRAIPADHPLSRTARFLSSVSLINLARNADAISLLADLHRDRPDSALLNNMGVAQLRRPAAATADAPAVTYFREAVLADPEDPDLSFNLGYAYWLAGDVSSAVTWLREAVRRNTADGAAHYVLGAALEASGNAAEGQREKELAKRLSTTYVDWDARPSQTPAVPPALERIKVALNADGPPPVQASLAAAGQRDQQELAVFHLEAGTRLFQSGRDADAIAELRRAIYLSPYDHEAHLLLGRLYVRGGRPREAVDEFKISIWSDDRIEAHLALAEAYEQVGDDAAARAELEVVLMRDPDNVAALDAIDRLRGQ